jgi:hypothetical protein
MTLGPDARLVAFVDHVGTRFCDLALLLIDSRSLMPVG